MKIIFLLLVNLTFFIGCKKNQLNEPIPIIVTKYDTISNDEVVKGVVAYKLADSFKNTSKTTLETLKKGSKKVTIAGKVYFKNNKGDYEIETTIEGKDTIYIYFDVVKEKNYDIKTKKLVVINLGEK